MTSEPLLSIRGASKSFEHVVALDRVDLDVHQGEVVALVGDNGAGKSTLINAISGTYALDSGDIRIEGQAVSLRGPSRSAGLATMTARLRCCEQPRLG